MKSNKFNAKVVNKMQIKLPSLSVNEGMARAAAAAFVSQLDPTATDPDKAALGVFCKAAYQSPCEWQPRCGDLYPP